MAHKVDKILVRSNQPKANKTLVQLHQPMVPGSRFVALPPPKYSNVFVMADPGNPEIGTLVRQDTDGFNHVLEGGHDFAKFYGINNNPSESIALSNATPASLTRNLNLSNEVHATNHFSYDSKGSAENIFDVSSSLEMMVTIEFSAYLIGRSTPIGIHVSIGKYTTTDVFVAKRSSLLKLDANPDIPSHHTVSAVITVGFGESIVAMVTADTILGTKHDMVIVDKQFTLYQWGFAGWQP